MRKILLTLVLLALATPALASDGVLEINRTCAEQTGCFAGDAPGWPVTIDGSAGRSYRLTSDLVIPNAVTTGIQVNTNDVGIDLNNFAIILSFCVAMTTDCTPLAGTGYGVEGSTLRGVSVKNGAITGMGSYGVVLGQQAEVTNVRVRWNRIDGIFTGRGSTVSGSTACQNGRDGIAAGAGTTVSGNTAYQNDNFGIVAGQGATASGNTAYENGDTGIYAFSGATVSGNTAFGNGDDGIYAASGTVSGNTAYGNAGDGIQTGQGSTVQGNNLRANGGYGLNLPSQSAYRGNVITFNTTGTVNGGVNMFSNSCNGTTSCP